MNAIAASLVARSPPTSVDKMAVVDTAHGACRHAHVAAQAIEAAVAQLIAEIDRAEYGCSPMHSGRDPLGHGQQSFNPLDVAGATGRFYSLGVKYEFF